MDKIYFNFSKTWIRLIKLLPPAYKVRWKVIFILANVCLFTIGEGGYPIKLTERGVPIQLTERGVPIQLMGGTPPIQDWMGYISPCPRLDGVPPSHPRLDAVPRHPSGDWSAMRALATWREVCLLRSRRRTFLCSNKFCLENLNCTYNVGSCNR